MTYRMVRFPSGREAGMTGLGDPAGERLAVLLHPTPGAAGFDPAPDVTASSGIHLLTFERPGYGASDPVPAGVDDWADDLAGYLRQAESRAREAAGTRYGGIGVVGWREGGIYAAALATRHPKLVERLVLVGAPTPSRASSGGSGGAGGSAVRESAPAPAADEPLGFGDRVRRMLDTACTQGDAGVLADRQAFQDPAATQLRIDAETLILYGAGDAYATVHDARWYAEAAPRSRVERVEGGADIIGRHWQRVVDFLTE